MGDGAGLPVGGIAEGNEKTAMGTRRKRGLGRNIVTWGAMFVAVIVTALFAMSYMLFTSAMHVQYERQLRGVINYVEGEIDADDMCECIRTGETSEKWDDAQRLLNRMVDDYECAFIYITVPVMRKGNIPSHMYNIVSSTTEDEVASGEEDTPLGDTTYTYPDAEMQKFVDAMNGTSISFFEESSEWGTFYTGSKPLVASDGEVIGIISADIELSELHHQRRMFILQYVVMCAVLCTIGVALVVARLRQQVVNPIRRLDDAMQEFTRAGMMSVNEGNLMASLPEIPDSDTGNEIDDLTRSFQDMTRTIRLYMRDLETSHRETEKAEKAAIEMAGLAHKDTMTGVKNKTAYNEYIEQLDKEIASPSNKVEFAVVVIDVNDLKGVNDTYGHQRGDEYVIGTCQLMSQVFKHSPMFRIGGDEFVAILRNHDYVHRDELLGNLTDQLREAEHDEDADPWHRYSASVGMARYHRAMDERYSDVFTEADHKMYDNKKAYKAIHGSSRDRKATGDGQATKVAGDVADGATPEVVPEE